MGRVNNKRQKEKVRQVKKTNARVQAVSVALGRDVGHGSRPARPGKQAAVGKQAEKPAKPAAKVRPILRTRMLAPRTIFALGTF